MDGKVEYFMLWSKDALNNVDMVKSACKYDGNNLSRCSQEMKCRLDVVETAIIQNVKSFRHANISLRKDKAIVMYLIGKYNITLEAVDDTLRDDMDVALLAIKTNPKNISYVSYRLKNNKELALNAISKNPFYLHCLPSSLKGDRDIINMSHNYKHFNLCSQEKRLK